MQLSVSLKLYNVDQWSITLANNISFIKKFYDLIFVPKLRTKIELSAILKVKKWKLASLAARAKDQMEKLRSLASSRWVLVNCTVRSTDPKIN